MNIYDILLKATELSGKTELLSIMPEDVGSLIYELASIVQNNAINGAQLSIRKTYKSINDMYADLNPIDIYGQEMKRGSLCIIYSDTSNTDNNKVYAFTKPGWEFITVLGSQQDYTKISEWSGRLVNDAEIQYISQVGQEAANIVYDTVKSTFLYGTDAAQIYDNNWTTIKEFQDQPYIDDSTDLKINTNTIFKALDSSLWIATAKRTLVKLMEAPNKDIYDPLPFDGFVSGVKTESVGAISVTSVVYDTAKGKFLGSNLLKYYDFWPATASYKADADYNDTDTNKAKDILFVNTSNGVVYKGPKLLNIQGGGSSVTVDSVLSLTSVNPVQNKIITEAINKLNESVFPLSLSVAGGGTFKKGTTQSITVRWTVKEGNDVVVPDTVKVNDVSVTNTSISKVFNGVTTTTSYKVEVTKGSLTKSASTTATFVNPSYIGIVESNFIVSENNIKSLAELIKTSRGHTVSGFNLNNQKVCYAYPKSFGILSSIKDGNGFENISSYTQSELTINGETYYVYVLTTAATISNLKQIYA